MSYVFTFGTYQGCSLDDIKRVDIKYIDWIMNKNNNLASDTKIGQLRDFLKYEQNLIQENLKERMPEKEEMNIYY